VKQSYRNICKIAHSEKITSLYVHYLEAIENDEDMYNEIYQTVKEEYNLEKKIVLQDWANSSSAIMLVSIDELNHGTIIDINSSCASLFGYERYEILNRPLKLLFTEELKEGIKDFLTPASQEESFYMTHKSGYLVKMKRRSQNYNSMETGMASIITLSVQVAPNHCYFAVDRSERIFGVSSSIISLVGLEMKTFEGDVLAKDFFTFPLARACPGEE
jgi:PAS domain S-box-containing protein